jgi:TPP-dependent trihydroxycyclohexane-1,2-dione (THcHDO) dehydratase
MIRRNLAIAFFAFGTVAGYGSALMHCCHHRQARVNAAEQHVARVCVDAARAAMRNEAIR